LEAFNINTIPSRRGSVAIVTGANVGLGYETALAFAGKDITVVMACRNLEKAENAKTKILNQFPDADLEVMQIDLSKLQSVRKFAEIFLDKYPKLDILVNNAGVMIPPYSETEDGFELQMGANHFGHFLLTGLLLDTLLKTPDSRVVALSSLAHKNGKIDFEDMQSKKSYSAFRAYAQSKLANLMFAYEMQRRLDKIEGHSSISVAAHPGASDTNLSRHLPKWLYKMLRPIVTRTFVQTSKAGAEPTLYAALGEDVKGGDYFGPKGFNEMYGRAIKVGSAKHSKDEAVAKKLWEVSEELTNIRYLN